MLKLDFKFSLKKFFYPLMLASLVFYFFYHIFQGKRGLLAWGHLSREISERQLYLTQIKTGRDVLQRKVDLMGNKICLDLLEEEAKEKLGVLGEDEVVLFLKKSS